MTGTGDKLPWLILGCAWLVTLFLYILMQSISPLLPVLIVDLGLSHSLAGFLYTLPILMIALFSYPFGIISDRIGMEVAIGYGIFVAVLSSIARSFSPNFTLLALSTGVFGLGFTLCFPNLPKMVKENFPPHISGTATGLYITAIPLGAGLGISLTKPLLAAMGGWREVLLLWSLMVIPVVILWWVVSRISRSRRDQSGKIVCQRRSGEKRTTAQPVNRTGAAPPPSSSTETGKKKHVKSMFEGHGRPPSPVRCFTSVLIGGLLLSLLNLIFYSTIGWLPTFLIEQGWHLTSSATVTSLISFSEIPAVVLIPMLSDRTGKRRIIIVLSFVLITVCSASVALRPSMSWLLSPVFGVTFGGVFALLLALPVEIVQGNQVGRAAGAILSIGYVGALLGPPLTGFLRDLTGAFGVGFLVLTIAGIVAVGLSFGLPERRHPSPG